LPETPGAVADPTSPVGLPEPPELTAPTSGAKPPSPGQLPDSPAPLPIVEQPAAHSTAGAPTADVVPATMPAPGEPYVASAIMLIPETTTIRPVAHTVPATRTPAPAAGPATSSTKFLQSQLKRLIENACGSAARDVQVSFPAPNHVAIRFTVRAETEAPRIVSRIREMQELTAFTIDDIEVMLMP